MQLGCGLVRFKVIDNEDVVKDFGRLTEPEKKLINLYLNHITCTLHRERRQRRKLTPTVMTASSK